MTKIVAVDAGHGINTPGKRTPDGEREWTFNNKVALAVIKYLGEYAGVKTIRLDDPTGKTDVSLKARTDKANAAKADVLVSCHHNANTGKWGSWSGTETFYYPGSATGKRLADLVNPRIVKAYGLQNRGVKSANFHMLRESKMVAILTEGGFMDSTIDIKKMRDNKVLEAAGKAIAEGIAQYLGLKKKPAPKPAPAPAPKPNSNTFYRVVTGSFTSKANANSRASELKKKGFDSFLDAFKKDGKQFYRVVTGSYNDRKNADAQMAKLKKAGFDSFIDVFKK